MLLRQGAVVSAHKGNAQGRILTDHDKKGDVASPCVYPKGGGLH